MRIAFLTTEYVSERDFDGGLANYLQRAALGLIHLGHEAFIIVPGIKDETVYHNGVQVFRVNTSAWIFKRLLRVAPNCTLPLIWIWDSWKMNQRLQQIHKIQKVDIVQIASCGCPGIFRPYNIPAVVRLSSFRPMTNRAYDLRHPIVPSINEYLEFLSIKKADALFCPSYFVANIVQELVKKKIEVIESPFVFDAISMDKNLYERSLKNKKYLLFFGTIGLLKGVKTIAEIIYPLLNQNSDLFFVFVGKDVGYQNKPMMNYVKFKAEEHANRIIYFNKLHHAELYPIVQHAQALTLPSRVDNLPNTCLEAMALGKIVIGTRGASFDQLIVDGVNGFLCEIDDPESLLSVIHKVLSLNEEGRKRVGMKAKDRIALLSPERVGKQLLDFYRKMIVERKK